MLLYVSKLVESMFKLLKDHNLPDKGVRFDDLIAHFVVCGDEACLMACATTGKVSVLGDIAKK